MFVEQRCCRIDENNHRLDEIQFECRKEDAATFTSASAGRTYFTRGIGRASPATSQPAQAT